MGARLKAAGLLLVIAACGAFFYWRFRSLGPIERTLSRLPEGLAIEAYVAPAALKRAPKAFDDLDIAAAADALALGLGNGQIYAVAAGGFDPADARAKLARAGIDCPAEFPDAPCVGVRDTGWLSVELLDANLMGVSYGGDREGVRRLEGRRSDSESAERARLEVRSGALAWAAVRSRRLEQAMAAPPEGWINLKLFARALRNAPVAFLTVRPTPLADGLYVDLEAPCADDADAAELRGIVEELNRFALKLSEKRGIEGWRPILESLDLAVKGPVVSARWMLGEQELQQLLQPQ